MPKISRHRSGTYLADFDFTGGGDLAATLNMYYCHESEMLESFPGFRTLAKFNATIHGIYHFDEAQDIYLVHAGNALYECIFINGYKDILSKRKLCDMADSESFAFRQYGKVHIFDGEDITVVDANKTVQKLSENPDLAYVPTTYINGKEAEQVNILSDLFKEEARGVTADDFALGSDGLIYEITSEKKATCAVLGAEYVRAARVDIPTRKMINGRYYTVTEIADGAFKNNTSIKTVVMSPSVKRVGIQAFLGCTALELAVMPDGIERIDSSAFSGCSNLTTVYLGVSCKYIYYNAFDNCANMKRVYISSDYEEIADCDGIGIMLNYTIVYNTKYTDFYFGVPVYTPANSINEVLINGSAVSYTYSPDSGTVILSSAACGSLEGADIVICGEIDREAVLNSERKTPLSLLTEGNARDAVLSATGAEIMDGRVILYGSPYAKSVALTSSKPISGDTGLLYFGELDYFAVGEAEYGISHIKAMAKYIIISKRDEMGGSIFVYTPKGDADAAFGRSYEILYKNTGLGIKSDIAIYHWMAHFVTDDGVFRMKLSSTSPSIEKVSSNRIFDMVRTCPALDTLFTDFYGDGNDTTNEEIIISTFRDYLVIIKGGIMLLGDSSLTRKTDEGYTYAWFTLTDIGAYTGEMSKYIYAESAPSGFYIHPDMGEACNEVVYSVSGADGELIYYAYIGSIRYAVTPTDERTGGTFSAAKLILPCEKTMIFGSEGGHICAFNTDKIGVPPKRIYEAEGFDAEEYKNAAGHILHPEFYAHDRRGVLYAVASEVCDGDAPYAEKRSLRDGLTARLGWRSAEPLCFAKVLDGDICDTAEIPMGDLDFSDFNFALLSMEKKGAETISILESQKKWVNKQIIVYTKGTKSPFAIKGLNFGFWIASKIKNN